MTQQDKELLLEDLCARLLYGVNGLAYIVGEPCNTNTNIVGIINKSIVTNYEPPMPSLIDLDSKYITIKPYLRPMSSMTKKETKELFKEIGFEFTCNTWGFPAHYNYEFAKQIKGIPTITNVEFVKMIDWLNAHHFDYRGLIEKGLAIRVTEENNPYKE